MSQLDYDADRLDDYDPYYDEHEYFDNSVSKVCNRCRARNLWWRFNGRWVLHEADGTVHVCRISESMLEAFPPI